MPDLNLGLPLFEAFLNMLCVPDRCVLNKPLYKKMFLEHTELDARDKKALKDDVEKIRWLYTLKPSTINIAAYTDDLRDYGELAILHLELSATKNVERIAHFINRAIPYPLVIFFTHVIHGEENDEQFTLCLADKRLNKADKEKWVIEELIFSPWLSLNENTKINQGFLTSLQFSNLSFVNFWQFYQSFNNRIVARQCAEITGTYRLKNGSEASFQRENLQQYQIIELAIKKLRIQLKQAAFNRQVELNTQIKKQEYALRQITERL